MPRLVELIRQLKQRRVFQIPLVDLVHEIGLCRNDDEFPVDDLIAQGRMARYSLDLDSGRLEPLIADARRVFKALQKDKKPKIYLRDLGVFHALQSIHTFDVLQSHPKLGTSWEGFALETVAQALGKRPEELFFWRTHTGNEVDLFWQDQGKHWAIEFKYTDTPRLTKALQIAAQDLDLAHLWIVYPGQKAYALTDTISVLPLSHVVEKWQNGIS